MKYFTKEWYELCQKQHYTSGMRKVPDKVYTGADIRKFYEQDLKKEIARDRRSYNTEPSFAPEETVDCFEECYRMGIRYGALRYPQWVGEQVDHRLLALNRLPESIYQKLQTEERKNRRILRRIEKKANEELGKQELPGYIRNGFCFHDANLLFLKRNGSDVELIMKKDGAWPEGTPYIKVIFKQAWKYEREKGLMLRTRTSEEGEIKSNCTYLYDEIYKTVQGFEIHMLLWTTSSLKYLTIGCEDIEFEDNIAI